MRAVLDEPILGNGPQFDENITNSYKYYSCFVKLRHSPTRYNNFLEVRLSTSMTTNCYEVETRAVQKKLYRVF